jgi:hypothetical protein
LTKGYTKGLFFISIIKIKTVLRIRLASAILAGALLPFLLPIAAPAAGSYLDNGIIKIGVDLTISLVGRVTPCAPFSCNRRLGAHRVTRPTTLLLSAFIARPTFGCPSVVKIWFNCIVSGKSGTSPQQTPAFGTLIFYPKFI